MRQSYVRGLEAIPHLEVTNRSIGSSPNVVLLDLLALQQDWDYNYIIVETAVVDFLQAKSSYSAERSAETLELFVRSVRSRSNAEIILLTIPTRLALLGPGDSWQEAVYKRAAAKLGLAILDGFDLVRLLIGRQKAAVASLLANRASRLAQAFGLDMHCAPFIAWRDIRDVHSQSNALGILSFVDHAHVSPPLHALLAALISEHIRRTGRRRMPCLKLTESRALSVVIAATPRGGTPVSRTSSLICRTMAKLDRGGQATYSCPSGFVVYGLMVNKAATHCFLRIQNSGGGTTFDLRFQPHHMPWTAVVVANLDPVGDGDVVISALDKPEGSEPVRQVPDTGLGDRPITAEVGELILVRRDWSDILPAAGDIEPTARHIETAPWAEAMIASAALTVSQVVDGLAAENQLISTRCFDAAAKMLSNRTAPITAADQARLMLLLGMTSGIGNFVDGACRDDPDNKSLSQMQALLRRLKAEDDVRPEDLLLRAQTLVRAGSILEADRLLTDGVTRFPADIRFFIESAWISYGRKDWIEAKRRWRVVADRFPDHHVGYLGLAKTLIEAGESAAADDVLVSVAARFPDNPEVARHRVLLNVGDP